jgi:signal transduction histidine kinase
LSLYIKEVAIFLDSTKTLNFVGLTFTITIVGNALILAKVFIGHNNRLILLKERRKKEEQLKQVEIEAVKSRYYKELKCLVHDLKTPLMTIQGLFDVIKMKTKQNDIKKYSEKAINSSENMDQMISEILNNKKNRKISIKELFEFIEAQLSPEQINDRIIFNYPDSNIAIYGNKIRISRALINIISNALKAIDKNGNIKIFSKKKNKQVIISIEDDGEGINDEQLEKIWEAGYSTRKNNTGLGLNFVKKVVNEHDGEIMLNSEKGKGTKVEVILEGI